MCCPMFARSVPLDEAVVVQPHGYRSNEALECMLCSTPVVVIGAASVSLGPLWSGIRVRILFTTAWVSSSEPPVGPRYVWSQAMVLDPPQQPHLKGKLRLLSVPNWLLAVGGQVVQ